MTPHRYPVGSRVLLHDGSEATIMAHNPYTFIAPAYDLLITGRCGPYGYPYVAVSERSMVRVLPVSNVEEVSA